MPIAIKLESGELALPSRHIRWPDLVFKKGEITIFDGSPSAPISDFFYFMGGLQNARRLTAPAATNRVIRREVAVAPEVLKKVLYFGSPLYELSPTERARKIGFVFNDPELSVVGASAREDVDHAFASVDMASPHPTILRDYGFLNEKLARKVDWLSGGELHRLQCLIAIERAPSVLFVDLTRSNLDDDFRRELCSRIQRLIADGCCVLAAGIAASDFSGVVTQIEVTDDGNVSPRSTLHLVPTIEEQARLLREAMLPRTASSAELLRVVGVHRPGVTFPASFSINRGEIVLLYGPNGCGKTSVGMIVARRCKRSEYEGSFRLADDVIPVMALQHAGRAFVEDCLFDEMPDRAFWDALGVDEQVTACHPRAVGYGYQKLAACALAISRSANLCILDEPTCGMDFRMRQQFIRLLNRYSSTAVLILTHDAALASIGRVIHYRDLGT